MAKRKSENKTTVTFEKNKDFQKGFTYSILKGIDNVGDYCHGLVYTAVNHMGGINSVFGYLLNTELDKNTKTFFKYNGPSLTVGNNGNYIYKGHYSFEIDVPSNNSRISYVDLPQSAYEGADKQLNLRSISIPSDRIEEIFSKSIINYLDKTTMVVSNQEFYALGKQDGNRLVDYMYANYRGEQK